MSSLGQLVETSRTWTLLRVVRESWLTRWDFGHGPKSPGTSIDPVGSWTWARVTRDIWSKSRDLRPGYESSVTAVDPMGTKTRALFSRTAGRNRGTSDMGPSHLGQLIDTAGCWTRA